jgi:hypothetical protein
MESVTSAVSDPENKAERHNKKNKISNWFTWIPVTAALQNTPVARIQADSSCGSKNRTGMDQGVLSQGVRFSGQQDSHSFVWKPGIGAGSMALNIHLSLLKYCIFLYLAS